MIVSATKMKNCFGFYLRYVLDHGELYLEKNGRVVARIVRIDNSINFLSDQLKELKKK